MAEDLNISRVRNILDSLELKITALNRGFIMLINVLQNEGVINENTVVWIDKIKRDTVLAKTIHAEGLLDKVLDLVAKSSCPQTSEEAIALIRSHIIKPKPVKESKESKEPKEPKAIKFKLPKL